MTIRGFKITVTVVSEIAERFSRKTRIAIFLKPRIVIDKSRIMDDHPWFLV